MKKLTPYLLFALITVVGISCSKFKESPDPEKANSTTGGGGGGGGLVEGGPFPGLWKLTSRKEDGVSKTLDGYYLIQIHTAGTCEFTHYDVTKPVDSQFVTNYILDGGSPQQIHFVGTHDGTGKDRTIKKKYTTQIIWEFGNAPIIEETLVKQ